MALLAAAAYGHKFPLLYIRRKLARNVIKIRKKERDGWEGEGGE
jgi:hypothetical protein